MINRVSMFSLKYKETQERHVFISYGIFTNTTEFWTTLSREIELSDYDRRTLRWHKDIQPNGHSGIFMVILPEEFA